MAAKGNWTKSLFIGLWTVLNFTRKLFFNLIFIVIFVGLIIAITGQDDEQFTVNKDSALFLTLNGKLVIEKESIDPFEQFLQESLGSEPENPEVLVRDVVKVLENAQKDRRMPRDPIHLPRTPIRHCIALVLLRILSHQLHPP